MKTDAKFYAIHVNPSEKELRAIGNTEQEQAEQGFDRLFGYNRKQTESFDYCNEMKNASISNQFRLQEQEMFCSFTSFVSSDTDNSQSIKN